MASTRLVADLIKGVQDTLQDSAPAFRRWPEQELVRYLNYGRMTLCKYLPQVSSRTDSIKLVAGAHQDLSLLPPDNVIPVSGEVTADMQGIAFLRALCNMGADGLTPGKAVRGPVDRFTKDSFEPNWLMETGTEVREIVFDKHLPLQFIVSPGVPASTDVWLRIQWMAMVDPLPNGGDPGAEFYVPGGVHEDMALGTPDQFQEDLHNYVVAMALLKGSKNMANLPKAQVHAQLFMQSINTQAAVATGVNPNLAALPFVNEIG